MNQWAQKALEAAERAREARLRVAELTHEADELRYALEVAQARVERDLIKRVGGEKHLAPSTTDRERIFVLARDASTEVTALRQAHGRKMLALAQAKAEERYWEQVGTIARLALQADAPCAAD